MANILRQLTNVKPNFFIRLYVNQKPSSLCTMYIKLRQNFCLNMHNYDIINEISTKSRFEKLYEKSPQAYPTVTFYKCHRNMALGQGPKIFKILHNLF